MRKKYLALVSLCAGTMLLSACGNLGSGSQFSHASNATIQ